MVYFPQKNKPKKTIEKKRKWGRKKMPVVAISKLREMVKKEVSSNIENKNTGTYTHNLPIVSSTSIGYKWFTLNSFHTTAFGGCGIFNITRGTQDNHRIGNLIKLKRWVIRGHIRPEANGISFSENYYLNNSYQGYVNIYFGKRLDGHPVDQTLPLFLQNGSGSNTPDGTQGQIFHTVNKDQYKVYYHKKFKMGSQNRLETSTQVVPNNDFNLTRTFGFDVCKYICKNMKIKWNDQDDVPVQNIINDLCLWATWTPAIGNLGTNVGVNSYYSIMATTYAEFEDA